MVYWEWEQAELRASFVVDAGWYHGLPEVKGIVA